MYSLNIVYKQKTKKITLPKNIIQQDLLALISDSFRLKQKLIGLANAKGNLVNIQQLLKKNEKQTLYLITAQDLNGDNMSFASDGGENMRQNFLFQQEKQPGFSNQPQVKIPQKGQGNYQGVIGDLQLFQSLFLQEGKMTIVLCFIKQKPKSFPYPYYLYHTAKNSVMIYMGRQRICEFFVESMNDIPKQVTKFIKSSLGERDSTRLQEEQQQKILNPFSKIKSKPRQPQQKQAFSQKQTKKVNKKRRQLQRDFFQQQYEQLQDYDDNKQAQQLLNEFGDQQPVQPQHQIEQQQQMIYGEQLQQDQQQQQQEQQLPIFQSQRFNKKQQKRSKKNIENKYKNKSNGIIQSQQIQEQQQIPRGQIDDEEAGIKASLLENLLKLKQDEDITQLQFYKMKSQLLQNLSDFMRKYQMGTRKGFRKHQKQRAYQKHDTKQRQRQQQQKSKKNKIQKVSENTKIKSRQNKQRPMSPLSDSSSQDSQLIAAQRPQEKLRQRLKQRQQTGEEKQRSTKQQHLQKQQQRQIAQQQPRQHRQRQTTTKPSSKHQKQQQQSYRQTNTRPIGQNVHQPQRQPSPPLKNIPTPYSNERRRSKKYQIPIIVRKYNNVIEKISTSYPLSQQQQQAINLILELELKGLITEKQSGVYKSSILQQDKDIFSLFLDYFDHLIDQLELVSRLKTIKRINSQKKQRSQHNMRLLIKYAKQSSYELLRNLLLENNHLVLGALDKFRGDKNGQGLTKRFEKIAKVYREKSQLETQVLE